jgi:hypothetical protein
MGLVNVADDAGIGLYKRITSLLNVTKESERTVGKYVAAAF